MKIFPVAKILILFCLFAMPAFSAVVDGERNADGSFKKWHRIEVILDGPLVEERPSTFRNYRLDVTFTSPSGKIYEVPGFFDADGDPANTSASRGNEWKARFAAGEEGLWLYQVTFVTGKGVAAAFSGGKRGTAPDGESGRFIVGPQDKAGNDFRAKGKLEYVGERYLRFADGDSFIKLGANSPEVLLEYGEFDGTPGHEDDLFSPHVPYWNPGDPIWGDGKGKGIIGLVNYLAGLGLNVHYFLCMNAYGDGREAWPWTSEDAIDVYDVSKLAQWEVLFTHFDRMGMMIHFQLSESENTNYFEEREGGGSFSDARKIFYREMVARFGHHLAITWNVGEENQAKGEGFHAPNTQEQRREFASWIRRLTCYEDHISVHNGPGGVFEDIFPQLIGYKDLTGPSLQTYLVRPERKKATMLSNHEEVRKWIDLSAQSGHPWVVSVDEPWWGKRPEGLVDIVRKEAVWGALMAGGHMEFYTGKDDVRHIDYHIYEDCWKSLGVAARFMNEHFARDVAKMSPDDSVVAGKDNWALVEEGETYLLYLKNGGEARVDLSGVVGERFSVRWFNPRSGGVLVAEAVESVKGERGFVSLGNPPNTVDQDWVAVLRRVGAAETAWLNLVGERFAKRPEFQYVRNDASLPNVLIYGDSISIGYTERVRSQLKGEANVYRIYRNGSDSRAFIPIMKKMHAAMQNPDLEEGWEFEWDVIHFNVGLHDLKYVSGRTLDKKNGQQVSSIPDYKKNLREIVSYLQKTFPRAKLVFATTTPVPDDAAGRFAGDARRYNEAALEVLAAYPSIRINDLYGFTKPQQRDWWVKPGDVHFSELGKNRQGDEVARVIREAVSE